MLKGRKILLGITGGIAAYKICNLVRLFVKDGAEVRIIMTPSATKFVSPITLSVLSKYPVAINMFPEYESGEIEKVELSTWHIDYGMWAEVFLIAPATANSIAKIVAGIADNFLLTTVLAARCPVIIAPSMDSDMLINPITQKNISLLRERGFGIIEPVEGELASGLTGPGRMPEPEDIFHFLSNYLSKKKALKGKKVLITAGPTREPIDPVRYISNYSSGKMGYSLAQAAAERGAEVTLISGPTNLEPPLKVNLIKVTTAEEMFQAVRLNFSDKDLIVMSAAVADFKVKNISEKKIKKSSQKTNYILELDKTPDILGFLGEHKKKFALVGFALETDNELENAKEKLKRKNLDFIVLNSLRDKEAGFEKDTNVITILSRSGEVEKYNVMSKYKVANVILDYYVKKILKNE
ncbi:MAG: bifunctional phosphopantothenoylcysteine decarboxylase/phosphopantothenate--cysteine ligase CoaBC [Ignavibacteria bacterium]